jgi:PPOX class probable F420-dependent enzyme
MDQGGLSQLAGEKYISIETYRKSGRPVRTPVWFAESGGILYVRTSDDTGKYKRIRNDSSVQVAPCDMRGNVKGEWVKAEARIVSDDEKERAYKMLEKKYGLIYKMSSVFLGGRNYVVLAISAKGD